LFENEVNDKTKPFTGTGFIHLRKQHVTTEITFIIETFYSKTILWMPETLYQKTGR